MKDLLDVLEELYKKVLAGATLENDNQRYVLYLDPVLSDQDGCPAPSSERSPALGVPGQGQPPSVGSAPIPVAPVCLKGHSQVSSARDVMLLRLTVIQVMVTRVLSVETECHAKETYREIIQSLLESSDFDSQLVCTFQNRDKLVSHMAAKCLARLLYFQLKEKKTLSNSWIAFCQNNLSEYSESDKVVYCLWTLTFVIKEIFKDTCSQKTEILKQLLTPFDPVCEVFYNSLFSQHSENRHNTSKSISLLVCFLELLELLIASRLHLKLHCTCQRILFLKASCALDVITWPVQAFVKRKFIIFIKKCLLWKVGEDLGQRPVPPLMRPDVHLDGDTLALADAVLQAVDLGLLRTLQVYGKPSCFGGEVQRGCEHVPGPDHVVLRATSLLIIKSLEIKFQNGASANEMKVDLQRFMSELLSFLKPHLQPCLQSQDPCEWLSRVFIEQDDDMLEAARASLSIYLKLSRERDATESLTEEKEIWSHHTHENGYNPHCIFLFFLKNVGFDSTVLLDFLISSETCFLEYFVRYLKLLQKDWDEFVTICKGFDVTELSDSMNICGGGPLLVEDRLSHQMKLSLLSALSSYRNAHACDPWASGDPSEPTNQAVMSGETPASLQAKSLSPRQASQSLVDYDSSDDSEAESVDPCLANRMQTSLHQEAAKKIQDPAGTSGDEKELNLQLQSRPAAPKEANTPVPVDGDIAPNSVVSEVGLAYRTVTCFQELQGAIYRLQKKNLFPYNPTALLKLLKQIEAIYNKRLSSL